MTTTTLHPPMGLKMGRVLKELAKLLKHGYGSVRLRLDESGELQYDETILTLRLDDARGEDSASFVNRIKAHMEPGDVATISSDGGKLNVAKITRRPQI